ncbi:unnamed protein product [Cylicocyclus nassatus]|uniref:glucuronosyltransferase n=1 Tax=Cylicocyclus nassatus TaxID=53992 RepID=A0AA36GPV0_CYLNA|nr:unnamed protein product [Cylicocyclus nassatus]
MLFSLLLYLYYATVPLLALEVALIPSTGCYSHDVMMKDVGQSMPQGTNITWIQTFLYDFGFGEMRLPEQWTRISIWGHDEEGLKVMRTAGSLLWEQNVPTDFDRPWDLRGSFLFFKMLERHQTFCEKMLEDPRFLQYMRARRADIVLLDHFLQECMGGLAYLLNSSVVQFSNWPIADGYITSLNIPANPSAVPKTGSPYSGLGMAFPQRVGNLLFHWVIIAARTIQSHVLRRMFARRGYEVDVIKSEAERIIYAGRSEFLFDVVRPINNRIKHFGSNQLNRSDFVTVIPEMSSDSERIAQYKDDQHPRDNIKLLNDTDRPPLILAECLDPSDSKPIASDNMSSSLMRRANLYQGLRQHIVKMKFASICAQFPELDWPSLTKEKFILVSFGSVAQAQHMPLYVVSKIFHAFAQSPYKIVWQTNSPTDALLWTRNVSVPENVVLTPWAPIKQILAHPNLQYLICHGGINTINELLLFGVPVVGVPLQGDQGSNLRRLTDLGAAVMVTTAQIAKGELVRTMRTFEYNLNKHWQRAAQLSSMLETYRTLHKDQQHFWIDWTGRHGRKLLDRNLFNMRYIGDTENSFWMALTATLFLSFLVVLC